MKRTTSVNLALATAIMLATATNIGTTVKRSGFDFDFASIDPYIQQYQASCTAHSDAVPIDELMADLAKLYGGLPPGQAWISRMTGELTREALDDDLDLGASSDQDFVNRYFQTEASVGTPPECPSFPPCDPWEGGGSDSDLDPPASGDIWGSSSKCSMGTGGGSSMALGTLALAAALAFSRRRRRG